MKNGKLLILLLLPWILKGTNLLAVNDSFHYPDLKGLHCENLWICDRNHGGFEDSKIVDKSALSCTTKDGVVYVGKSSDGTIQKYDLYTGKYLGEILVKNGGESYIKVLGLSKIGFDEYGHFYVASYNPNFSGSGSYQVFLCNLDNGALKSVGDLSFGGAIGRVDYCDVIGDLTGVQADCTIGAVASNTNRNVFLWTLKRGTTNWTGGWNGDVGCSIQETYPAEQSTFSTGSAFRFVRDGSRSGVQKGFYIDGGTTFPAFYDKEGILKDSFANVDKSRNVVPQVNTNGILEAEIGSRLLIYSEGQYNGGHSCQTVIASFGANSSFSSMESLWTIPADGFGKMSDGGNYYHCLDFVKLPQDAQGRQAMLLVTYKCFNGIGVYKISQEGYEDTVSGMAENVVPAVTINVSGDVVAVSEVAESIEIFNITGQKVASVENAAEITVPANGAFIVKAVVNGNVVVKKVIL